MASFSSIPRCTLPQRPLAAAFQLYSICEEPSVDYEIIDSDLGAGSPKSVLSEEASLLRATSALGSAEDSEDVWRRSGIAGHINIPMRDRNWRFSSFVEKIRKQPRLARESVDRDCGICFEVAVSPSRALCCGKLFCLEHISQWLHGANSEGRCASCGVPCSLETGFITLPSPVLKSSPPAPAAIRILSSSPDPILSRHSIQAGKSHIPQPDSTEPVYLEQRDQPSKTQLASEAETKFVVNDIISDQSPMKRAIRPPSNKGAKSGDVSLRTSCRRISKSSFGSPRRHFRRGPTSDPPSKASLNVTPRNSNLTSPRNNQEGTIVQLLQARHNLAIPSMMCEVAARAVGRLFSVIGLVILFWVLLA